MISSFFRGRNTTRPAYICSSCFSHSRLPLSFPYSPPHTLRTCGNRTWRVQVASFSNSRATCNGQQLTSRSIEETSHGTLELSAGQIGQTGLKAKFEQSAPSSRQEDDTIPPVPRGGDGENPLEIESTSKTSSSSEWRLRARQVQDTFLKDPQQPAIETQKTTNSNPIRVPPEWSARINDLKSTFLTDTLEPTESQPTESQPTKSQPTNPQPIHPEPTTESAAIVSSEIKKIEGGGLKRSKRTKDSSSVSKNASSVKKKLRARTLLAKEQSKLKSRGSQKGDSSTEDLDKALLLAFETSFDSGVSAAIEKVQNVAPSTEQSVLGNKIQKSMSIKEGMRGVIGRKRLTRGAASTSRVSRRHPEREEPTNPIKLASGTVGSIETLTPEGLNLGTVNIPQPPVPSLSYGLDRVLFNPGVYHLQDPRSRVFNFDPYLQTIMPIKEFDFSLLKRFVTSSRDKKLLQITKQEERKYTGSTSSMTAALSQFHYLLSNWRQINTGGMSKGFPVQLTSFTSWQRSPASLYLRWRDGVYALDADKQHDTSNVLSMLGQSMEKLLTLPNKEYERYRRNSSDPVSYEEAGKEHDAFHYTTLGDFLMRSQLDAYDPRIPGTGMFDLKTRAVISIRMDTAGYEEGRGYEIRSRLGEYESFEREYYDMIRSAFLKYSLQVRIGRMDGIFVAFHNTERIFGFQYISLPEMDAALHGTDDTTLGDSEFKLSVTLLNRALDQATTRFPNQSLRLVLETRPQSSPTSNPFMYIFAEPMTESRIEELQSSNKDTIATFEREVLGLAEETEEDTVSGERIDKNESGDESAHVVDATKAEVGETDKLDEAGKAQPLSSLAWDFDAEDQEKTAESTQTSSSLAWDFDAEDQEEKEGSAQFVDTEKGEKVVGQSEDVEWDSDEKKESTDSNNAPKDQETSPKELIGFILTARSTVNGEPVQRPKGLKSEDKWTLEYALAEIESPKKARELYSATLRRRMGIISQAQSTTNSEDSSKEAQNKYQNFFKEEIKKYTKRGMEYRKLMNAEQSREPLRVYENTRVGDQD